MKLLGMLDSPYVRRTAITLRLLDVDFEHEPLSVFTHYDAFKQFNPVVKVPTLLLADGSFLMDSTLIIDYVEHSVGRSLMPTALDLRLLDTRFVGLALAACDKTVQIVYERMQRPADKQHAPWLTRVSGQLLAACDSLEALLQRHTLPLDRAGIRQAAVTTAVAWRFTQLKVADVVDAARYPALVAFSARAEALAEFKTFAPD